VPFVAASPAAAAFALAMLGWEFNKAMDICPVSKELPTVLEMGNFHCQLPECIYDNNVPANSYKEQIIAGVI
jgi:hypothetical protein